MGTMFSILLPMKRMSKDILDQVASTSECRRYSNPAVLQRRAHDLQRSSPFSSPKFSPDNSCHGNSTTSKQSTASGLRFSMEIQQALDASLNDPEPDCDRSFTDVDTTSSSTELSTPTPLPPQEEPQSPVVLSGTGATSSGRTSSSVSTKGDDSENAKYHILVVDDSPLNRKMLSKLLKSKGHR